MTRVETPLKWLLNELPALIEPAPLEALMERYRLHKADYERQIKVNQVERTIKTIQYRNNPDDAAKLARWHAKLAKLKEETA
jgi:hypothetical protein